MTDKKTYELIKFEDGDFSLDVNVSPNEDTVWLTIEQIALLYNRARNTISEHINNILNEKELDAAIVCRKNRQTAVDGKIYITKFYNLDMILSVGYRVKSKRGNIFRRWANSILKQYLLNGHVIDPARCLAYSDSLIKLSNHVESINTEINKRMDTFELRLDNITSTSYFKDKIFYNGELFEGYVFIKNLFNKATNRIIIIDSYLDFFVLEMLNDINIPIIIYINSSTPITNREIILFQQNHNLNVIRTNLYHDRFLVIDNELYNIGSSIKDIGKKISHISKLECINIDELLNKYI